MSEAEAARRLLTNGPNAVDLSTRRSLLAQVFHRLTEPLVAILLIAALVSGATGDLASLLIIAAIITASIGLGLYQENRAGRAAEALKRTVAIKARVVRDGQERAIPVDALVTGDIVRLKAGDLVPADGVVLSARAAAANESLLTGEPYPADKRPGPSGATDAADAFDALFGGTALISGEATMVIVATGAASRFGGIAAALENDEPPTAFERGLTRLGQLILRLTIFLVLLVLLAHLAFARPPLESFMFAVALAVGLTPELLPMVLTVTLSRGAVRMAQRKVIVKRLAAIHDLGAMDVLCTDKTGTLTQARIALAGHPDSRGVDSARVIELAALNSRFETGVRSPLDDAILTHAAMMDFAPWRAIDDLPFDFERRRVSVLVESAGRRLIITKGAAEEILLRARDLEGSDGKPEAMSAGERARLAAWCDAQTRQGLRLLGVAYRPVEGATDKLTPEDETQLTLCGFCAFVDPPKQSAADAVQHLRGLGVRVKILSGDAPGAVEHVVSSLGLDARGLLTGAEIARLNDSALQVRVRENDLYARLSPDQKTRVIRALQAGGSTVGFLGDGINDAPAIKAADAGLSVEGATDVARAAADMILLESDLGVLAEGVREGRRTYANVTKYIRMGTSSNFGNMLSMALASLAIPFLPLTAIQILLNNLLYDISQIGIPFDNVDGEDIAEPHTWDIRAVLRYTMVMGPLSSVFDLMTFALLLKAFGAGPEMFRTAWFVESVLTQMLVVFLIRTSRSVWRSQPHELLTVSALGGLAAALMLALGPWAATFGFGPLPLPALGAIVALALAYLACAEGLKGFAMTPLKGPARIRAPS